MKRWRGLRRGLLGVAWVGIALGCRSAEAAEPQLGVARARVDLGYPNGAAELGVGLGEPEIVSLSLEAAARVSLNDVVGALHARFETGGFVLRGGPLYQRSYQRGFLEPAEFYELRAIDRVGEVPLSLWALHGEALWSLPIPMGSGGAPLCSLESESELFSPADPDLRQFFWFGPWSAVLGPGLSVRQRLGLRYELAVWPGLSVEPTVEMVWAEARAGVLMRAGFIAAFAWNAHFSLRARVLPAVETRDIVGLAGGQALTLTLRYDGDLRF